ncbi:elongation factor G-like protein EF-G2 [Nocardiopsis changdeensis]|uniref:Elongation factor G-like protein EF-G2 n=1 Tax=Nocardiopsis changdeensis TaxID=2831969 RepID=A0ABX8BIH2_9ACTN|nr:MULTISPECIES: elongation factor G-like protein EF-G2 [Nocardiopsis]QUX21807.1 elongation factor G-like protein EF-G2 [Nocardiopsis changdeensis]QYX37742.1 elongation factor G-like protein EF-G2 [Nocardiopsis sp. MT53]
MVDRAVDVPRAAGPAQIRNIALVGPAGAGKTSLVEALLSAAGTIHRPGSVEEGTTVSDRDEVEIRQKRSVHLTVNPVMVGDVKVNLLDTPGYADFIGAMRAGLRGADAALFVVSALEGVDGRTRVLWEECAAVGMPRAVAVTKVDHPRADFEDVVAQCREAFGGGVHAAYLPAFEGSGEDRRLVGLWGLVSERYHDYDSAGGGTPPENLSDRAAALRETLVEEVITESEDEVLMERYMEGGALDPDLLIADLQKAVAAGGFHPVLAIGTTTGVGVRELLRELPVSCPDPTRRPFPEVVDPQTRPVPGLSCDPDGPLVAEVLATASDPYVGRTSLVRVFSGTLSPDSVVHLHGHGVPSGLTGSDELDTSGRDERAGGLSVPVGRDVHPVGAVGAGDVCLVAKLPDARTGDTLSSPERPLRVAPWRFPEPLLPVAISAASSADEDRLSHSVARLVAEDPSLRVEVNPETHQMVLWTLGEAHLDAALDRLEHRYGVRVETGEVRVPLRTTFSCPAEGMGRNVKQSGGHGEFGICRIKVEPLESGAGLEFVDRIVGGVVPRQYIPSVEKGVRAQMADGVDAGYPLVDIRVTLYDGKAHSVDSSDMAFQKAARLALKDAAAAAELAMLEPVDSVEVEVDDELLGTVMSDLSARRGRVVGSEPAPGGRAVIRAEVPELEITRYAVELRSLSHGTGVFTRRYLRHEPLPPQVAAKLPRRRDDA